MKIFGIDLGTTYSCIAYVNDYGQAEVIPNAQSKPTTPSVVAFEAGGNWSAGQSAKDTLTMDPDNVVTFIKREMGKRDYFFNAFGTEYNPEEISAFILKKITKDAENNLGEEVKNVVITCPAYFGMDQREATKAAGKMADLNVLAILNEPTAAAISYGLKTDEPQTVMVYDLGGGTFDVTIIKVANGRIDVVATGGDHMLGGKDWDEALAEYIIQQSCKENGESPDSVYEDNDLMADLELKSELAKYQLTEKESTMVNFNGVKKIVVTRQQFNEMTAAKLEETIIKTRETMQEAAKKGVTSFDKILLVGGSTRMLQVEERVKREFPDTPVEFCDPDQSVAKGAAFYGLNMAAYQEADGNEVDKPIIQGLTDEDKKELQKKVARLGSGKIDVSNVLSQSIAVRMVCEDNKEHIVNQIYKQTNIPYEHVLEASTVERNQTTVLLEIFENGSTDEWVDEDLCNELVSGEMGPLPSGLPKDEPIKVVFKVDANGSLSIDAEHEPSHVTKHLEVQLKNALTEEQIQEGRNKMKQKTQN